MMHIKYFNVQENFITLLSVKKYCNALRLISAWNCDLKTLFEIIWITLKYQFILMVIKNALWNRT